MKATTINPAISKRHINAVSKFNLELEAFRNETGDPAALLFEDANTTFTLRNVRVEGDDLVYEYDGREEREVVVQYDEEEKEYYEDEIDGIAEYLKFWRSCLRRAKRYWSYESEKLDAIQDGEIEDENEDE